MASMSTPRAGESIGHYRVLEKIGEGGMGEVFKAEDTRLQRFVALKFLPARLAEDPHAKRRFNAEALAASALDHPNICAIYDIGETREGMVYLAFAYCEGLTIKERLIARNLSVEQAIDIALQIASGLEQAHSRGIVHRDIKPANIMLNRRGGEPDAVKVLDFGLVKALGEEKQGSRAQSGLTGTPLYMSPESIQTPDLVDARSDLYALGAVAYFLLTGQPVFDATSIMDLCQMHMTAAPTPPSQRLGRAVSSEIEHAILACLEKNRAKRPQTARDLVALLDRVPSTGWSLEEADEWWSRHERGQAAPGTAGQLLGSSGAGSQASSATGKSRTVAQGFEATMAHDSSRPQS